MRSTSGETPAPGKVGGTSQLAAKGIAPRPPSPSKSDATDPAMPMPVKPAVTPRAPSVASSPSRGEMGSLVEGDVRTLALAVAKELVLPLEARIAELEARLAKAEAAPRIYSAESAPATVPDVAARAAVPVAFPPLAVAAIATSAAPVTALAVAPAAPTSGPKLPAEDAAPKAKAEIEPKPKPKPIVLETPLSSDELAMFDGAKRKKRIGFFLVFLLLLGAGALITAMVVSRS
jgi:ribonuclease E